VVTAKARINVRENYSAVVPVVLPGLDEVRALAAKLHVSGKPLTGEAFGWPAEFHPGQAVAPLESKMAFTPSEFCIGENGVWFFSLMWEHGEDAEPTEYLDDSHILTSA